MIRRSDGEVHFKLHSGKAIFKESEVLRIVRGQSATQIYQRRRAELAFTDVAGHYKLAQWCKVQGLRKQMIAELNRVTEIEPDHRGARNLLGQLKVGKRWLPKRQAMRALGYIWHRHKWHRPESLTKAQREQAIKRRVGQFTGKVEGLLKLVASPKDLVRLRARDSLLAFARDEGLPQLAEVAGRLYRQYSGYWMSRRKVVTEIRLGFTSVGNPMRTLTLNLGGTSSLPVTIQLPQVSSISAKTTTILPGNSPR